MSEINSNGKALTGGDLLAKNSLFNLIGQGVPLVAAIIAIPLLIRGLGIDRFGVLTLTWMVIGYFSLFDLGLGRALTLFVSSKRGTSDEEDIPALVWTSLGIMFALGLIGALALSLSSYWLINSVLKIPNNLKTEALSVELRVKLTHQLH
jgi:O-antigen/teichoic acid export membrane protein